MKHPCFANTNTNEQNSVHGCSIRPLKIIFVRIKIISLLLLTVSLMASGQNSNENLPENTAGKILNSEKSFNFGGYGEINFNQGLDKTNMHNAELDVQRLVVLFGYQFNSKTKFISEIEFEHVKEVYVEQAFLQYNLTSYLNLRGGLLLIPMGIINEYHESPSYFGVERPLIDQYITPSTWREIGFGISGSIIPASLRYQAYLVNGISSYNGAGLLNGKDNFRKGRQKGAESFMSSPALTAKVEFYGIPGLNIGISGYSGKTQSVLYDGISKEDPISLAKADSSVVGINMLGIDSRYNFKGLKFKLQYYLVSLSNTEQYNQFTRKQGVQNDLGSRISGYYFEAGYNILRAFETELELSPFFRYSRYNSHGQTKGELTANPAYNHTILTTGIDLKLADGAVLKSDIRFLGNEAREGFSKQLNIGIGLMF